MLCCPVENQYLKRAVRMARCTYDEMQRDLLSLVIDEGFDPTVFRIMILYLTFLARVAVPNASSPSADQYIRH